MQYLQEKLTELRDAGKTKIALNEAAVLFGSSQNKGGEFAYTDAYPNLRLSNPLRAGTRQETMPGAAVRWVAKTGEATFSGGPTGPWGYPQNINTGNPDTVFWSLAMQDVNSIVPIRSWIFEDLPQFGEALFMDIARELYQREGQSAAINVDTAPVIGTAQVATGNIGPSVGPNGVGFVWNLTIPNGTAYTVGQSVIISGATPAAFNGTYLVTATAATSVTFYYTNNPGAFVAGPVSVTPSGTTPTGAASGLRGLDSYTDGTTWAWGASGEGNGRHTLATVTQASATSITFNELSQIQNLLPPQFWGHPTTLWQVSPTKLNELRTLKDSNGLPVLLDVGESAYGTQTNLLFGRPVMVNPYLSARYPLYLMCSDYGLSFVDYGEINLEIVEQYIPGTSAIWAQKRVAFAVRDPSAVCRIKAF